MLTPRIILLLPFLFHTPAKAQNTPAGKTYHARTSVNYEKPPEYYVLSFDKDSVEVWEHKVEMSFPVNIKQVNKKKLKWRLGQNRVYIAGLSEKGLYLNGDELQGQIDYPKPVHLMFVEQPLPNGRYLMQLGSTCKKMVDGGCTLTDFRVLEFRADSVDIWYYTEADCVPSSRERSYNSNIQPRKTYAWTVHDSKVMITEQQLLTFSAGQLREMKNQAQQQKQHYYLVRYPVNDSYAMKMMRGGYLDQDGDTIIPIGKYARCYSDTIRNFGIVGNDHGEYRAIDNRGNVMYGVARLESWEPDTLSESFFRIYESDGSDESLNPPFARMGYADSEGNIVIKPRYALVEPFKNGKARATNEFIGPNGMARVNVKGINWFYIDRKGNRITP